MSTQQSSQLSSQAARSTAAQSARPVLHARQLEPEEDASSVGSPLNLTAVEAARPYLLLKAIINLEDTTEVCHFGTRLSYARLLDFGNVLSKWGKEFLASKTDLVTPLRATR